MKASKEQCVHGFIWDSSMTWGHPGKRVTCSASIHASFGDRREVTGKSHGPLPWSFLSGVFLLPHFLSLWQNPVLTIFGEMVCWGPLPEAVCLPITETLCSREDPHFPALLPEEKTGSGLQRWQEFLGSCSEMCWTKRAWHCHLMFLKGQCFFQRVRNSTQ